MMRQMQNASDSRSYRLELQRIARDQQVMDNQTHIEAILNVINRRQDKLNKKLDGAMMLAFLAATIALIGVVQG